MNDFRFFFLHVMRTGGASLARQLEKEYRPGEVYPDRVQDLDETGAHLEIGRLLSLGRQRTHAIRLYTGHFPFFVTEHLPTTVTTLTILRHPVRRTVSVLQSKQLGAHRTLPLAKLGPDRLAGMSLEDLYDDPELRATMLDNFQTRQFAMTIDDHPATGLDPLELDSSRVAVARENLGKVDALGLYEHYEDFIATLRRRFGWKCRSTVKWHVSEPVEISSDLAARIAEDNAIDIAFYDFAADLYCRRNEAERQFSQPG